MKKIISVILAVILSVSAFTSCSQIKEPADDEKLSIVVTIFPEYDWVRNILGEEIENVQLTLLLDSGVDLHSFQPTADDILNISRCDLFIYVGGESDGWVEDALGTVTGGSIRAISLLDILGDRAVEEELAEGMEGEDEAEGGEEDEGPEYDEHVWLSLRNAAVCVKAIEEAISSADPDNAGIYSENAAEYVREIEALDAEYSEAVSSASVQTLLFGDRFPFRYLTEDYGLGYYAAFLGCSAETEASFETVTFLASKVDELSLGSVLTIEGTDHRIAETIVNNTQTKDQKILVLDSMQGTSSEDIASGADYLNIMRNNLGVLKEALR